MNISVYVFKRAGKESGQKVNSFPTALDKGTQKVIEEIDITIEGTADLVVHRKGNLVYYIYAIKVEDDIFGYIFILNNAYLAEVGPLCRFCNDMTATLAARHLLVKWSPEGKLKFDGANFVKCDVEAREALLRLEEIRNVSVFDKAIALPPLDLAAESHHVVMDTDDADDVGPVPEQYRQVKLVEIFLPEADYPVEGVLRRLNDDNRAWSNRYDELTQKYTKLNNQKKRMKWVIILGLCIVAAGVALLGVNKNLKTTKQELVKAENDVDKLMAHNAMLLCDVDTLMKNSEIYQNDIDGLKRAYVAVVDNMHRLEHETPIKVTSMQQWYVNEYGGEYTTSVSESRVKSVYMKVNYEVNRFKVADISAYPSVGPYEALWWVTLDEFYIEGAFVEAEPAEVEVAEEPAFRSWDPVTSLNLELRCYYKPGYNDAFTLKERKSFTQTITTGSTGSFSTPRCSLGFSIMPVGVYRFELWYGSECFNYEIFEIR